MASGERNRLIVEGEDDKYAVVELMDAHVAWGDERSKWPVQVVACGSYSRVLRPKYIETLISSREVEALGIVIDADEEFALRWANIRKQCEPIFAQVPQDCPARGLVLENADGKRFGLWIMPDNRSRGMLETLLRFLIPGETEPLWELARQAVAAARAAGATFKEPHLDKAYVHTWLAWQDPPGESLGRACKRNLFDRDSESCRPFVDWFVELYRIDRKPK